jgi:MFS family permease
LSAVSFIHRHVPDPNIRAVYTSILCLGTAYGLAISVVGTFLDKKGLSKEQIGNLAIWFAGGLMLFSLPAGALIRKFGGKPVLAVALLGYAAVTAIFPFAGSDPTTLGVIRFFDGAFSVAAWVSSETILLSRAPAEKKAFFTSIYAMALALGYVVGPLLAWLIVPRLGQAAAFVGAGVIAASTAAFVSLRLAHDPPPPPEEKEQATAQLPALSLFSRVKTSCLATFSYGYFQASVVLFLPIYLRDEKGFSEQDTVLVPAFFAAGMLLFANLAARVGDRLGHLAVMRALAVIGTCCVFGFLVLNHYVGLFVLVFFAGASFASVSPVSLALQGIVVPPRELTRSGGMYNASYAIGMLIGPSISSHVYGRWSGRAMNLHFAFIWIFFVLFTIVFRRDDPRARIPAT